MHHRRRRRGPGGRGTHLPYLLVAFAVGFAVPRVPVGFTVPAGRAVEALVSAGIGIVTFIGIVYSLLFLVVQFGTTTFTPRLNLFRDAPIVRNAFGYFAGILVFSFTAAFSIGADDDRVSGLVPVTLALLLLVALAVFRRLQVAALHSIQLATALAQVTDRGRGVIDTFYPDDQRPLEHDDGPGVGGQERVIRWPGRWAVLQEIDVPRLLRRASSSDVTIEFVLHPGQTVTEGSALAVVRGMPDDTIATEVLAAIHTGYERTFEQDVLLAPRVLADIALRALSTAINDPTTAVQALDALDSLLRQVVQRRLEVGRIHDAAGRLRVVVPMPTWADFVSVAFDELLTMTQMSIHVSRRVRRLLEDLLALAPADRQAELTDRIGQLPE